MGRWRERERDVLHASKAIKRRRTIAQGADTWLGPVFVCRTNEARVAAGRRPFGRPAGRIEKDSGRPAIWTGPAPERFRRTDQAEFAGGGN